MKIINLKITEQDLQEITGLADRFAKGNVSAWIRHAALRYAPKTKEKIEAKGTSRPKEDGEKLEEEA